MAFIEYLHNSTSESYANAKRNMHLDLEKSPSADLELNHNLLKLYQVLDGGGSEVDT